MALSCKDIADLRLRLIREYVDLRGQNAVPATFALDRDIVGELLARADAFEKIRKLAAIDIDKNIPAELRYFRARVQDAIREFGELLAASERVG